MRRIEQIAAGGEVVLPHGTEVLTKEAREEGALRVPAGSVGRVVRLEGERVHVAFVGRGTLAFARDELVPRRSGQHLFAQRREAAFDTLRPCVIVETVVGSRAWNLDDAGSDTDRRGVFVLPLGWTTGLVEPPVDLVSADGSSSYWEVDKAIRQALRADPNTLEALFVPSARALHPMGERLLEERDAFVSRDIYGSFARYALAQLRRLEQGVRLARHRHAIVGWLREEPGLSIDALAERLARETDRADVAIARQWVKQLYRSLHDRGLVARADLAALVDYAREASSEIELPRELRPKNAYNLVRLLHTAERWLREGRPTFAMEGAVRGRLLAIKRGEVPLEDVLAEAEALAPSLEAARDASPLPERPDLARADRVLRAIRLEAARRAVLREPGSFGADAPVLPEASWSAR